MANEQISENERPDRMHMTFHKVSRGLHAQRVGDLFRASISEFHRIAIPSRFALCFAVGNKQACTSIHSRTISTRSNNTLRAHLQITGDNDASC